jgi:predicted amidohydrolase YtcJ
MGSGTEGKRAVRILLGNVLVLDSANTTAVAVADGRIRYAGRRDNVMQLRDEATQVHDFGSRTIIPGFNDSHAHSDSLGLKTIRPTLEHAPSIAEGDENQKGPMLPGYLADMAVLSGNPLTATTEGLLDTTCEATMVGGSWMHIAPP